MSRHHPLNGKTIRSSWLAGLVGIVVGIGGFAFLAWRAAGHPPLNTLELRANLAIALASEIAFVAGGAVFAGGVWKEMSERARFGATRAILPIAFVGLATFAIRLAIEKPQIESYSFGVAVLALLFAVSQSEFSRRQFFGDVFFSARVRSVRFFVPDPQKHSVPEFAALQRVGEEVTLATGLAFEQGKESPAHILFNFEENQTLLRIYLRFADCGDRERDGLGDGVAFSDLPRIQLIQEPGYQKASFGPPTSTTIFGWHNDFQIVYPGGRRVTADTWMPIAIRLVGVSPGTYKLRVRTFIQEARRPHEAVLVVHVSQPTTQAQ